MTSLEYVMLSINYRIGKKPGTLYSEYVSAELLYSTLFIDPFWTSLGQKKKIVMLPSHAQNLKIGSVGWFFFFFLRTVESWVFQYFFLSF